MTSSADRVTAQVAAQYDCRPLREQLTECLKSSSDCAHEKRLLAHCTLLADDKPATRKPSKQGLTGRTGSLVEMAKSGDCSEAVVVIKECLKMKRDAKYCIQQIEDYRTCKMMVQNMEHEEQEDKGD